MKCTILTSQERRFQLSFVCYIWPQSKLSNDTRQTTLENFCSNNYNIHYISIYVHHNDELKRGKKSILAGQCTVCLKG